MDFFFIERKRQELIQVLKVYIEGVISESGRKILDKTWVQRLFDYPPLDLDNFVQGTPLFCKDPDYSFENILMMGKDFPLLLWDIAVYQVFDLATGNTLIALGCLYVAEKFLMWVRAYFGERNLSQKTLVDEAFLV